MGALTEALACEMDAKTRAVFLEYKERFGTRSETMLFLETSWKPRILAAKMKRGLTEEQGRCEYNAVIRRFLDPILPSEHAGYLNAWAKLELAVRATDVEALLLVLKEADAEFATFQIDRRVRAKIN